MFFVLVLICLQSMFAQELTFIHVDQFGYLLSQEKVAVLSNPQIGYNSDQTYAAPTTIAVINATTNETVLEAPVAIWNNNQTHESSGDQGWWFDFSEVTAVGSYYLYDATNDISSATFQIDQGIYTPILRVAGRMFYFNRCNAAKEAPFALDWEDGMNFNNPLQDFNARYIYDQTNVSLEKDLSGGWFDAGDYNKYVTFTHTTLHDLLNAFEENPQAFDDQWNIPESNNGIPDIIDEIKWELDWLLKMTNDDGSVHIKMGNRNFNENTSSPPSANVDGRYYGPTCTSASITVASVFAHAALVFSQFTELEAYASLLLEKAIVAYDYAKPFVLSNTLQTNCDDGSIVAGDTDRPAEEQQADFLTASIYLLGATSNPEYNTYNMEHIPATQGVNYYWGPYTLPQNDALLYYTTLPEADLSTKNLILNRFETTVSENSIGFFGFNTEDLYRAYIPEYSYHWGSNSAKAGYGILNTLAIKANVLPDNNDSYKKYVDQTIHYFHGVNPQNTVYLSNMYALGAEKSANEIYHTWFADGTEYDHALNSAKGPAPGFVVGGPNQFYSVSTMSPPFDQPSQKSYLDFNDSNSAVRSWEITEPAIYYQARYLRLLANNVNASNALAVQDVSLHQKTLTLVPNPARHTVKIMEGQSNDQVSIYNAMGALVKQLKLDATATFTIVDLKSGVYFVSLKTDANTYWPVKKLIIN